MLDGDVLSKAGWAGLGGDDRHTGTSSQFDGVSLRGYVHEPHRRYVCAHGCCIARCHDDHRLLDSDVLLSYVMLWACITGTLDPVRNLTGLTSLSVFTNALTGMLTYMHGEIDECSLWRKQHV